MAWVVPGIDTGCGAGRLAGGESGLNVNDILFFLGVLCGVSICGLAYFISEAHKEREPETEGPTYLQVFQDALWTKIEAGQPIEECEDFAYRVVGAYKRFSQRIQNLSAE